MNGSGFAGRVASALCLGLLVGAGAAVPAQPARESFPGALGYGRFAQGGRGGAIIHVTSLADAGPGTLRACIMAEGPRTCVFDVGGIIRFTSPRPIINNPYLTIAGQTAPGGIVITHAGGATGLTPLVIKKTHDIVIRHVRVRIDRPGEARGSNSGIVVENSHDVMIDHVSTSWAQDENIGGWRQNDRVTIANSIFAEGMPPHDKCALLNDDATGPQNISFVRNLCAHNGDRNPDVNFYPGSCVDVVNNVIYNPQSDSVEVWEQKGGTPVNIVANFFKAGPNTNPTRYPIARQRIASTGPARIFQSGNVIDGRLAHRPPIEVEEILVDRPVCPLSVPVAPAREAYQWVLSQSGAFPRDAIDQRIVKEVRTGTGRIRKTAGTLVMTGSGEPRTDSDRDGMSDDWERGNGSDPGRPDAWADADGDGWANMDEFLDAMHAQVLRSETRQLELKTHRSSNNQWWWPIIPVGALVVAYLLHRARVPKLVG